MAAFQKAIDATDRTASLSFTDSSQPIQIAVGDLSGVSISVSGTFTGSLSFEGSVSGTSWSAIDVHLLSDNSKSATITATGQYGINPTPFSQIRIVPAVASGSALVELLAVKTSSFNWLSAIWKLISDRIPALSNGKIPVEVGSLNVTVGNASLEIANDAGNPIPISDAGGSITVDGTFWQATQPISAASLPLPTQASTSALQTTGNTSLATIATNTGNIPANLTVSSTRLLVDNSGVTQPVSGTITANLGTIAGVATTTNQETTNTSLASINSKIPALGQALAASSTPVVLTASQLSTLTPLASVGITGTLPAFAATPTFNIGTISTVASEATLSTLNTKLPSNLTVSATRLLVDGSGVTQPVSMAAAPAGLAWESTATITRAANTTAYTANDVYGGVFEITNIGASGGFVFLNSLNIIFNITALPSGMGAFAVYLFNATPPSAITDNLPYSLSSGDRANIKTLNGISLTASLAARGNGGSVVAEAIDINRLFKLASGQTSLWGYLVTLNAFTPSANSETATIRAVSFAP